MESVNKSYFTGKPCKNGHIEPRYVNTNICYGCKREQNKRNYENNPERYVINSKLQYAKHKIKKLNWSKEWAKNNRDKSKDIKRKNKLKYKELYNAKESKRVKQKRLNDPLFRLNRNISKEIWAAMQGQKQGKTWKFFVKDSINDIKIHLESLFTKEMSWHNYGHFWEIDHITPLSWFQNLPLEEAVSQSWSISNLQPLECSLNRSKQNFNDFRRDKLINKELP